MTDMEMRSKFEELRTRNELLSKRLLDTENELDEAKRDLEAAQKELDEEIERAFKHALENSRLRQQVQDVRDLLGQSRRRVQAVKADLKLARELLMERDKAGVGE